MKLSYYHTLRIATRLLSSTGPGPALLFSACRNVPSITGSRHFHYGRPNKKDYYKILGISKNAPEKEIKKAYYQLAKKYHPDVNKEKGAAEKFQEVSEAYEVLSDSEKRRQYDALGAAGTAGFQGAGDPNFGWQFHSNRKAEDIFKDIFKEFGSFENIFGRDNPFGSYAETEHGFDASQQIATTITFEEAARGITKDVLMNVIEGCRRCQSTGVEPPYKKVSCPYCNGTGMVTQHIQGFYMQSTCSRCKGQGAYNKNPCMDCEGHGRLVVEKHVDVRIPAGVDNGQTLRTRVGKQDVYVYINVLESLRHKRVKENIYTDVEISLAQAVLGGTVPVPGIEKDHVVRIPPATSSHAQMCLKNQGIKRLNTSGRGDQFINIKIRVPKRLTDNQKALMQAWAELEQDISGTVNKSPENTDTKPNEMNAEPVDKDKEQEPTNLLGKIKRAIFG
uniref:Uncharacterized protein n=1 Tax=Acrobeloides nanus TaxID=290746 RepID=A0A914DXJ7_9BILA